MKISVILCTHNPREQFLQRTLAALRDQTLPFDEWELLLIDNASSSSVAAQYNVSWHPRARHLEEDKLGKLNAWRLGISEAKAEILLFLDDDNVLARDYLEQALMVSAQWPFVGVWGGSILPEYEVPVPHWVGNQIWRLTVVEVKADVWGNQRTNFTILPVGAGLCVRREVTQRYLEWGRQNKMSSLLDRSGKGLGGYGDMDLCHCAIDLGLGAGKSTALRLTHLIPAERLTLDYFVRHAEGDAISYTLFRALRGLPVEKPAPRTLTGSLRWFFHRLIYHVPREQYEIQKAHERGIFKGWQMITDNFPDLTK